MRIADHLKTVLQRIINFKFLLRGNAQVSSCKDVAILMGLTGMPTRCSLAKGPLNALLLCLADNAAPPLDCTDGFAAGSPIVGQDLPKAAAAATAAAPVAARLAAAAAAAAMLMATVLL
eukprot:TRINITY_DN1604_c1_g1_i6.p1 TRINITY_DN1604_c1_g1~~TRINITY_DN1604_c1_g1_i6.p1  ORF type:complete len:119 (+),score=45.37 TRINITY_DN1604_c1_g1_i6:237-593(+)